MPSYQDRDGNTVNVTIDVDAVERCRSILGVDLYDLSALGKLAEDMFRFLRDVLSAATAHESQIAGEIQTAEKTVKERLLSAGYDEPVNGVVSRGCYGLDWIARHGIVLAAKGLVDQMASFIASQTVARQENERQMQALTDRLSRLREAVLA